MIAIAHVVASWPDDAAVTTARLRLEPVRPEHAAPMVHALADPELYHVIGGTPPTLDQLAARYQRWQHPTSDDGDQGWLNWIISLAGQPVGTLQATLSVDDHHMVADLAWILSTSAQGSGYATEAARSMVDWLTGHGVTRCRANIVLGHRQSEQIAIRLGMRRTSTVVDGEHRWVREC